MSVVLCSSDCASAIAPSSPIPLSVNPQQIACVSSSKPCVSTNPQTLNKQCFQCGVSFQHFTNKPCTLITNLIPCVFCPQPPHDMPITQTATHTTTMAPHHQCPALSVLCLWPMHHTTLSHHLPQSRFLFPHPCTSQIMALAKHIHKRVL